MIPGTEAHAEHIGRNLRDQDLLELTLQCPEDNVVDTVIASYQLSVPLCFTVVWDGEPVAMFGVAPTAVPEVGAVWMLGTPGLLAASAYVSRFTLPWVEWMNNLYPTILNECHSENTVSLRWLKHAGFTFGDPKEIADDVFFTPFWRTPSPCAIPEQSLPA